MTDPVQKMLDMGADSVAGDVIFKNKVLGTSRNGVFSITPEGEAFLAIDDVEVKQEVPKAAAEPKPAKASKAKKVEAPVAAPVEAPAVESAGDDLTGDLDSLLA